MKQDIAKLCAIILMREGGWCRTETSHSGGNPNLPRLGIVRTKDEHMTSQQHIQEVNPFAKTKEGYEQNMAIENWLHKHHMELLIESKLGDSDNTQTGYNGYKKRCTRIKWCLWKLKEKTDAQELLKTAKVGGDVPSEGDNTATAGIHLSCGGNSIEIHNKDLKQAQAVRDELLVLIQVMVATDGEA